MGNFLFGDDIFRVEKFLFSIDIFLCPDGIVGVVCNRKHFYVRRRVVLRRTRLRVRQLRKAVCKRNFATDMGINFWARNLKNFLPLQSRLKKIFSFVEETL